MCDITELEPICSGLQVGLTDKQEQLPSGRNWLRCGTYVGTEERLNFNDKRFQLVFIYQGLCVTHTCSHLQLLCVREGCGSLQLDDRSEG